MRRQSGFDRVIMVWVAFITIFLVSPLVVAMISSLGSSTLATFPPDDFDLAAYRTIDRRWTESILTSLLVSGIATSGGIFLGTLAAVGIARGAVRGSGALDVMMRSPVQVPALVIGVAFLLFYTVIRRSTGFDANASIFGLVLANICYTIPFVFSVTLPRLLAIEPEFEEAAYGLGAQPIATFLQVTLPMIRPAIVVGGFIAFFMSFDNLPLSIFLVASGVKIFPVELFAGIQFEVTRTVYAVATVVALGSASLILLFYRHFRSVVVRNG